MSDFPPLAAPWSRVALVHDDTDLFDPETMDALDKRYHSGGLIRTGSFNALRTAGRFEVADTVTEGPPFGGPWYLDVHVNTSDPNYVKQVATTFWDGRTAIRMRTGSSFTAWRQFAFV